MQIYQKTINPQLKKIEWVQNLNSEIMNLNRI